MSASPRSARLVAWGNAWLDGRAAADDVLTAVRADDDHHELFLDGEQLPLALALGTLRRAGVRRLRLVLPVPGDVTGLAGSAALRGAATATGEAVVADGRTSYAFVPEVERHESPFDGCSTTVCWRGERVSEVPVASGPQVEEADAELREAVATATRELARLDVARWRPELAEALTDLRRAKGQPALPEGYPPRARRLLASAESFGRIVALAVEDDFGGAVTGAEARGRAGALRNLDRAVRRARVAAYNDTAPG